jgi:predicted transcriptional regulator
MLDSSGLYYQRLREITAELADKKFLRYIEPDEMYITTDKGDQIPGGNKRDRKKERLTRVYAFK